MKLDLLKLKRALPFIKATLEVAGEVNGAIKHKHQDRVDKALGKAYRATEVVERVL